MWKSVPESLRTEAGTCIHCKTKQCAEDGDEPVHSSGSTQTPSEDEEHEEVASCASSSSSSSLPQLLELAAQLVAASERRGPRRGADGTLLDHRLGRRGQRLQLRLLPLTSSSTNIISSSSFFAASDYWRRLERAVRSTASPAAPASTGMASAGTPGRRLRSPQGGVLLVLRLPPRPRVLKDSWPHSDPGSLRSPWS